jgi:hypothetical protein
MYPAPRKMSGFLPRITASCDERSLMPDGYFSLYTSSRPSGLASLTAASTLSWGNRAFSFRTASVFGRGVASIAILSTLSKYCSTVLSVPNTYLLPCSKIGVEAPCASTIGTRCCWITLLTGSVMPLP